VVFALLAVAQSHQTTLASSSSSFCFVAHVVLLARVGLISAAAAAALAPNSCRQIRRLASNFSMVVELRKETSLTLGSMWVAKSGCLHVVAISPVSSMDRAAAVNGAAAATAA